MPLCHYGTRTLSNNYSSCAASRMTISGDNGDNEKRVEEEKQKDSYRSAR